MPENKLIISVIVILALWLVHLFITRILLPKVFFPKIKDFRLRYKWRKSIGYVIFFLGALAVMRIWFAGFESLATFFGLVSAGLTIALKDIISDIAGWLFIMSKRPFTLGDRIEINGQRGDVIDIEAFQFTLLEVGANRIDAEQSTGRMIHIPNGHIFAHSIANYTKGFEYIWDEIPILITFESNRKKAKEALQQILVKHTEHPSKEAAQKIRAASGKFMIAFSNLTPKIYTDIRDSGVLYTLRYLTSPYKKRDTIEAIMEDVLDEFDKHDDIDFAYPTRRVFSNAEEGKAGLK